MYRLGVAANRTTLTCDVRNEIAVASRIIAAAGHSAPLSKHSTAGPAGASLRGIVRQPLGSTRQTTASWISDSVS